MLDTEAFADVVARLYEASALPEAWPAAIASLAGLAGCAGGLIFTHSSHGTNWVSCDAVRPLVERFIAEGWMERNDRMVGLASHAGSGFVGDHDVFSDEVIDQMPVYRDFLRPNGFGWGAATHVRSATGDDIVISLERRYERGPVSPREIALLDAVRPHLARASVIASKLRLQRAQASLDSFEKVGAPAALIAAGGSVAATNPGFETLRSQFVARAYGRIALRDSRANALLQAALSDLAQDRAGDSRSIPVPPMRDAPAFIVHIAPIRRQARDIFAGSDAILFVTTADRTLQLETSLLCELYDLTRAEAHVTARLLEGLSVEQIAAQHGVSRETVRSQLKKVLAKTGCRSQGGLIGRLAPLTVWRAD